MILFRNIQRIDLAACLCALIIHPVIAQSDLAQNSPPIVQVVLPLDYHQKHLFVTLQDDQLGPLQFMLDTGAEKTYLFLPTAKRGKIDKRFFDHFVSINGFGDGSTKPLGHVSLSLHAQATKLLDLDAGVMDSSAAQLGMTHPMDGILGWDFFQKWCVRLDYGMGEMRITDPAHCSKPEGKSLTFTQKWTDEGLLLPLVLSLSNGRSLHLQLHLDTGTDGTMLLNPRLRTQAGLENSSDASANTGRGMNGSYATDVLEAKDLAAEDGHPKWSGGTMTVAIGRPGSFSKPHWFLDGPGEAAINHDGVIGNSLLEYFTLTFDPSKKQLYGEANTHRAKQP